MNSLSGLNKQQKEAVTTIGGPVMILAGAGSGKTRVIIERIVYLVKKKFVSPKQILAVTFTNKAAEEMRVRLKEILSENNVGIHLSTFHSLGVSLLRKSINNLGYKPNFIIYDARDQFSLIKTIIEEHDFVDSNLIDAKRLHYEICKAKSNLKEPEEFLIQIDSLQKEMIGHIYSRYQEIMKGCNAIDFEDILSLTLKLFDQYPKVMKPLTESFRYIMVDEYQDTNQTQYQLLMRLANNCRNLCVVGDDDQSIYGWRGAEIRNILDFEQDFPEVKFFRLEQNYRSTKNILSAANQVICENSQRMPKKLWSEKHYGEKLGWIQAENEVEEMESVVRQIRTKILQHGRSFFDYSILYRSNFQSRLVEEALIGGKIPYRVIGSTGFYEREEIRDAMAYLKFIFNNNDEVSLHRIVNVPRRGIGKISLMKASTCSKEMNIPLFKVLSSAREYKSIPRDSALTMEVFSEIICNFQQRFAKESLGCVFEDLLKEIGYIQFLETQNADIKVRTRRVTNVQELLSSVKNYSEKNPDANLQSYLERISFFSEIDNDSKIKNNQVSIMTIHSAKGLEFPFVFMVGMSEGLFPNPRAIEEVGEDEERRLCYVGITRAMEELTFSMSKTRNHYGEIIKQYPSRFLLSISKKLLSDPIIGEIKEDVKKERSQKSRAAFFSQFKRIDEGKNE